MCFANGIECLFVIYIRGRSVGPAWSMGICVGGGLKGDGPSRGVVGGGPSV